MSPKPAMQFGIKPSAPKVSETQIADFEAKAEARGNAVAGQPPSEPASSQARKLAKPPAGASAAARSGTQADPHVRTDGVVTRSTTIHLPVELHQELRVEAAKRGVHMSSIVAEALGDWLNRRLR